MFVIWCNIGQNTWLYYHKFSRVWLCSLGCNLTHKQNLTLCQSVFLLTVHQPSMHMRFHFVVGRKDHTTYEIRHLPVCWTAVCLTIWSMASSPTLLTCVHSVLHVPLSSQCETEET